MELRLFPLHTVLFPGMDIPLNVFEPRYLQLVHECSEAEEPFGIALIREGPEVGGYADPFPVGTTARIRQLSEGVLNAIQLLAQGEQRFRILELHHDRPYLRADVEAIDEAQGDAPAELVTRAQALLEDFEGLRYSAQGQYIRRRERAPSPARPGALADAIGATGVGAPGERQQLLETLDPRERLERAVAIFEPELAKVRRRAAGAATRRWSGHGGLN